MGCSYGQLDASGYMTDPDEPVSRNQLMAYLVNNLNGYRAFEERLSKEPNRYVTTDYSMGYMAACELLIMTLFKME